MSFRPERNFPIAMRSGQAARKPELLHKLRCVRLRARGGMASTPPFALDLSSCAIVKRIPKRVRRLREVNSPPTWTEYAHSGRRFELPMT